MSEIQADLSALTVEEVLTAAEGHSLEALEALESKERDGQNRSTLIAGLQRMQEEIMDAEEDEGGEAVPATEPPPETIEPLTGDDAPPVEGVQEEGGDVTYPTAPVEQDLPVDAERESAPVDEVMPIIRSGDWARISGSAAQVPAEARGRDVEITSAVIRIGGPDEHSDARYEYQLEADPFSVQMRDGGLEFECTRAAFAAYGPDRGYLDQQIQEQVTAEAQAEADAAAEERNTVDEEAEPKAKTKAKA
jgi:hypothetical protein